jgi:predicted dehydrogenase
MAASEDRVRYGVVGLGYFAQAAVLPAFARARSAHLVALFSNDPDKREKLGDLYDVPHRLGYDEFDAFLDERMLDAVYITLPNALHADYAIRAAERGVHVLCEKPLATSEEDCLAMIEAAHTAHVKLMTAYRLHFEAGNMAAIDTVQRGDIGDPRLFSSVFTMQVKDGNSRLSASLGGGPLHDIGIYCINAARYLFQDEPIEVSAFCSRTEDDPRFMEVDEQISAMLRFPRGRLATFTASFGAAEVSRYQVVGTEGMLTLESAYDYATDKVLHTEIGGKHKQRTFKKCDQVASELVYFSHCILENHEPEPSGVEGLADVRIMRALIASEQSRRAIEIDPVDRRMRPNGAQAMRIRPHGEPPLIGVSSPSR